MCWFLLYPVAGQLGTRVGIEATALWLSGGILLFTAIAAFAWPREDVAELDHVHEHVTHTHDSIRHKHPFVIDDHHDAWPAKNARSGARPRRLSAPHGVRRSGRSATTGILRAHRIG